MIEIDAKPIPLPVPSKSNKRYRFSELEPDQSFFVPGESDTHRLAAAALYWTRKLGWKFTCRTVEGGVRVWRIKDIESP
jgi:hypothetical protein